MRPDDSACPPDEVLLLVPDGELERGVAAAVHAHLAGCPACARRLAALHRLDEMLAVDEAPLPAELARRLEAIPGRPRHARLGAIAALTAAAALLLVLRLPHESDRRPPGDGGPTSPATRAVGPDRASAIQAALLAPTPAGERWLDHLGGSALPVLHRLARADDERAARAALVRIGALADRTSLPTLLAAADREDRRDLALPALGRLADPRAVPTLERLLADPSSRDGALEALESIGGPAAVEAVARRLGRATDVLETRALLAALGRTNGAAGTRALLRLVSSAGEGAATRAIFRQDPPRWVPHLLDEAVGRDEGLARAALDVLADLAPPEAVDVVRRLLDHPTRSPLALRVLLRIDTPSAAAAILEAGAPAATPERFDVPTPQLEALALDWLDGDDRRRQVRALHVLGGCGSAGAVAALERAAGEPALAPLVVDVLGLIPGPEAAAALGRLGRRPALARDALEALGRHAPADAVPEVLALGRAERTLREPAIRLLGEIGTEAAVEAMVRLDGHPRTQRTLLLALRDMERDVVVPTLVALLDGELSTEARRALRAVGGAPPARPRPTTWIQ